MKNSLVFLLLLVACNLLSQKNDYQWLFGYANSSALAGDTNFGGVVLDFNYQQPQSSKHIREAEIDMCNVSYCDNNGSLLFYSNCARVFDRRDSVMLNGDTLNRGEEPPCYCGLRVMQGIIALPAPEDSQSVYLFHYPTTLNRFQGGFYAYLGNEFYYSRVNLSGNNGYGEVAVKNQLLTNDTLSYSYLSAVRHGNGRDWWVLRPHYNGRCYYEFLLNDAGVRFQGIQCLGLDLQNFGAAGTSCFSPNGEKYFWVNAGDSIRMFDFDRCTGMLSNPQVIQFPYPNFGNDEVIVSGIAVSPNNRYLYVFGQLVALQYDLQAASISSSVDTIGIWDGTYRDYPNATTFFCAQPGPDGKIYVNTTYATKALHVVTRPDMPGDSCLFLQHNINLQAYNSQSLPNFPNYRLGAWQGSACDTLSLMTSEVRAEKEKILNVYPNPATDIVTIDYGFTDWNRGEVVLEITNTIGQLFYQQHLPKYSGYQRIDVKSFANGLYIANIKRQNHTVAVSRFVKE